MSERIHSVPGSSPCCKSTISIWEDKETILSSGGEPLYQESTYNQVCDECGQPIPWPKEPEPEPPVYTQREYDEATNAAYQQGCEEGYRAGAHDAR